MSETAQPVEKKRFSLNFSKILSTFFILYFLFGLIFAFYYAYYYHWVAFAYFSPGFYQVILTWPIQLPGFLSDILTYGASGKPVL